MTAIFFNYSKLLMTELHHQKCSVKKNFSVSRNIAVQQVEVAINLLIIF